MLKTYAYKFQWKNKNKKNREFKDALKCITASLPFLTDVKTESKPQPVQRVKTVNR